jgi:hypothetical protein
MNSHAKKLLNITLISLFSSVSTASYASDLINKDKEPEILNAAEFQNTKAAMISTAKKLLQSKAQENNTNLMLKALNAPRTSPKLEKFLDEAVTLINHFLPLTSYDKMHGEKEVHKIITLILDHISPKFSIANLPQAYSGIVETATVDYFGDLFELVTGHITELKYNPFNINEVLVKLLDSSDSITQKRYLQIQESVKTLGASGGEEADSLLKQIKSAFVSANQEIVDKISNSKQLKALKMVANVKTMSAVTTSIAIISLENTSLVLDNRTSSVSPAAGDENNIKLGVWASGLLNSSSYKKNDNSLTEASYGGFGATIGIDTAFNNKFIIGLAYSITRGKGSIGIANNKIFTGVSSLYGRAILIDQLSFNANVKSGGIKIVQDQEKGGLKLSDFEGKFVYDLAFADNIMLQPYLGAGYTNIQFANEVKQAFYQQSGFKAEDLPALYNKARVILGASLSTNIITENTTITPKLTVGGALALGGTKSQAKKNPENLKELTKAIVNSASEGLGSFFRVGVSGNVSNKNGLEFGAGGDMILSKYSNNYSGYVKLGVSL